MQATEKALHYFIEHDYYKYKNDWFSYALNEVTKYVDKDEYYIAGLQNIEYSLDTIINKTHTSHTDFEMLMQGFELYDRIVEKNLQINELKEFPTEKFLKTIRI